MYEPRFPRPNYGQQHPQWRSPNARYRPRWHMPPRFVPSQFLPRPHSNSHNQEEEYWCETCDRGFRTKQLLENHNQQHQKCNIDGCQFIAHPKVITKHIQMQHSTGLFKKIPKLNNPEEIKKWREERRKRYPTKVNVDKKIAEIKEKVERGEKMGLVCRGPKYNKPECGIKRKHNNEQNHRQNTKRMFQANNTSRQMKNNNSMEPKNKPLQKEYQIMPVVEDKYKLKPFTGIQDILNENDSDNDIKDNGCSIDDDDCLVEESSVIHNSTSAEPSVCGALTLLMSCYDSSDDESSETKDVKSDTLKSISKMETDLIKIDSTKSNEVNSDTLENIAKMPMELIKYEQNEDIATRSNDKQNSDDDDGAPDEVATIKASTGESSADILCSNVSNTKQTISKNPKIMVGKNVRNENVYNRNNPKKFRSKIPSTLLEKLLNNEIRHERNIILQCIRHIVKNNYFEKTKVETKQLL